jgi:hypothetical protein
MHDNGVGSGKDGSDDNGGNGKSLLLFFTVYRIVATNRNSYYQSCH